MLPQAAEQSSDVLASDADRQLGELQAQTLLLGDISTSLAAGDFDKLEGLVLQLAGGGGGVASAVSAAVKAAGAATATAIRDVNKAAEAAREAREAVATPAAGASSGTAAKAAAAKSGAGDMARVLKWMASPNAGLRDFWGSDDYRMAELAGRLGVGMRDFRGEIISGFAEGGSFTVAGRAGSDANVVPLRLTRGERVDITPEGGRDETAKQIEALRRQVMHLTDRMNELVEVERMAAGDIRRLVRQDKIAAIG